MSFLTTCTRGIFFFTGPVLLLLTMIFEWAMGNFFPMMVCGLFCVFWLSFGLLQLPTVGIAASYSATGNASEGALSVGYNAGIALYLIALGFTMFTFFIFTLKTNTVFALIFACTTSAVFVLASAYWHVALGKYTTAIHLQHVCPVCLYRFGFSTDRNLGWRGSILHCGSFRLVHYLRYDGC
jgi:succinate-acetate transporter protein